jgi:large subunit ribosomal protein L29
MQATEIRELNDKELEERIAEFQEERFRLRLRAATQPLEQPHRLRELRKDIARMKTVLHERRMKGSAGALRTDEGRGSTESKAPEKERGAKPKRSPAKRAASGRGR